MEFENMEDEFLSLDELLKSEKFQLMVEKMDHSMYDDCEEITSEDLLEYQGYYYN